jgi:hypothetical protein
MIGQLEGYALIRHNPTTHAGMGTPADFSGKIVRCLEINPHHGGVLVINAEANAMATFDEVDVRHCFRCQANGNVLLPPCDDIIQESAYLAAAYDIIAEIGLDTYNRLVVSLSLTKGEFDMKFLRREYKSEPFNQPEQKTEKEAK